MNPLRVFGLMALIGTLAACSSDPDQAGASRTTYNLVLKQLSALLAGGAAPSAFGLTRAGIADYPDPLIVATTENGNRAGLVFAGQNGPWRSWRTLDGVSFTTRNGVMTATRGFGDDLLSTEASGIVDLVRARAEGQARRVERRLDGDNKLIITHFLCTIRNIGTEPISVFEITHTTQRLTEDCSAERENGGVERFENTYWVGARGIVWRSDQRVGPRAGRVILEQLIE